MPEDDEAAAEAAMAADDVSTTAGYDMDGNVTASGGVTEGGRHANVSTTDGYAPSDDGSIGVVDDDAAMKSAPGGGVGPYHDNAATRANFSVARFEEIVVEANRALLGCNTGWSRYLDWHLGVYCEAPQSLDKIGPKLCVAGHGFHAHISSPNKRISTAGSIWSDGVGGSASSSTSTSRTTSSTRASSRCSTTARPTRPGSARSCDLSDTFRV